MNGGLVDAHKGGFGGFDAFGFDVTPFLKNGSNELIVAVTDPSDTGEQPRGKQQLKPQGIWYTPVSGIWQTVWLEPVPSGLYLAELRLTPDLDARGLRVVGLTNEAIGDDTYAVRLTTTANGRTAAFEAIRWEIEWLRQAGFNMLRKHIKVEPARYYYHCDKLGMLVWQDMPSGFNQALRNHPPDRGEPVRLSVSREQHELELRRMLGRLHNSPSIVTWVVFNEGWGQYETRAMAQWVKTIDRRRLVNANSGWLDMNEGDLYDVQTYDETLLTPKRQGNRAVVLGEYGGVGWPIQEHLWNPQMRNWGYQTYQERPPI